MVTALVITSCLTYCRPWCACSQSERLDKWWYFTGQWWLSRRGWFLQERNSIVLIAQCAQTQIRYKLNCPDLSPAKESWETNLTVIIISTDGWSKYNSISSPTQQPSWNCESLNNDQLDHFSIFWCSSQSKTTCGWYNLEESHWSSTDNRFEG